MMTTPASVTTSTNSTVLATAQTTVSGANHQVVPVSTNASDEPRGFAVLAADFGDHVREFLTVQERIQAAKVCVAWSNWKDSNLIELYKELRTQERDSVDFFLKKRLFERHKAKVTAKEAELRKLSSSWSMSFGKVPLIRGLFSSQQTNEQCEQLRIALISLQSKKPEWGMNEILSEVTLPIGIRFLQEKTLRLLKQKKNPEIQKLEAQMKLLTEHF